MVQQCALWHSCQSIMSRVYLEVPGSLAKGHSFGPWVHCYVDGNFCWFRIKIPANPGIMGTHSSNRLVNEILLQDIWKQHL